MLVGRGGREGRLRNPLGPVRVMKRGLAVKPPPQPLRGLMNLRAPS